MGGKLKARAATSGDRVKLHTSSDETPDQKHPAFSFRYLTRGHDLTECTEQERLRFLDALEKRGSMSWGALRQAGRKGLGYEIIPKHVLTVAVPAHVTPDINIIAFRCIAQAPMIGYRTNDGIFHILWIDRAFDCYDHG